MFFAFMFRMASLFAFVADSENIGYVGPKHAIAYVDIFARHISAHSFNCDNVVLGAGENILIFTFEVLHKSMASSLSILEQQIFTLSTVTFLQFCVTNVQLGESLKITPSTERFSQFLKCAKHPPTKRSDKSPLRMPRPRMVMFLPSATIFDFTTAPPAKYKVWLSFNFIFGSVCTPAPKYTTFYRRPAECFFQPIAENN